MIMLYSVQIALLTPIVFVVLYLLMNYFVRGKKNICIVVLGDIGRSPRIQYHALSFAKHGFNVMIVGYEVSVPHKKVLENERIDIVPIREAPRIFNNLPVAIGYILRAFWLAVSLTFILLLTPKCGYIFVQNPPTIPTFPVVWLTCLLRRSEMVVDWHNYGYTILSLKVGDHHPLVVLSQKVERVFGRSSSLNFCVTNAMKEDLAHYWNIKATTLYDRPPDIFTSTPLSEQHELFVRLAQQYPVFAASELSDFQNGTAFTESDMRGEVTRQPLRPALLVSSTSWTEDEDFGLLLDALEKYETASADTAPRIVCVITGKGPQKEIYKKKIANLQWKKVQFCLPWLTAEDYPLLLGSADLGVCLHKSSSGLDLPMKVVDMFGCGLPVCAIRYDCIEELVKPGLYGMLFDDSEQLAQQLQELLTDFPEKSTKLKTFHGNLKKFQAYRWDQQWDDIVLPLFKEDK